VAIFRESSEKIVHRYDCRQHVVFLHGDEKLYQQALFGWRVRCEEFGFLCCLRVCLIVVSRKRPDRIGEREVGVLFRGLAGARGGIVKQNIFVLVESHFDKLLRFD
jgi:hypothetical protein